MSRPATKHVILSATAHVGLVLFVLAAGTAPATVQVSRPYQHVVILAPVTRRKLAAPPRRAAQPPASPAKMLGPVARTMKIPYAVVPAKSFAAPLAPPALESEPPLPGGEGLPGLFGLDAAGNGGGSLPWNPPPSNSCRAPADPVEILSKPNPAYSAEARELRLEGEVLLQVVFEASGDIRFLRVTRGLAHGLDEAAIEAAKHIRFKPARCAGVAMDVKATVHVTFRLTKRQQPEAAGAQLQ